MNTQKLEKQITLAQRNHICDLSRLETLKDGFSKQLFYRLKHALDEFYRDHIDTLNVQLNAIEEYIADCESERD